MERPSERKINTRFVAWNVWDIYKPGSLNFVTKKLAKCLDRKMSDGKMVPLNRRWVYTSVELGILTNA